MRYLDNLSQFPEHAKVCLYGAGDFGISLYRLLEKDRPDVTVVCFVDSFKTTETIGLKTLVPDALLDVEYDFIVIASHHFEDSIAETLDGLGIDKYCRLNPIFNSKYANVDYYKSAKSYGDDVLYAFYDFTVSPYGFDIIFFMYLAEIERRRLGVSKLHPVLVPGVSDMLIQEGGAHFEEGMSNRIKYPFKNTWWYRNIIVPTTYLVPSCNQLTICNSREEAWDIFERAKHVYPATYSPHHPVQGSAHSLVVSKFASTPAHAMPSFTATPMALEYVGHWIDVHLKGRKLVTITLRESPYKHGHDKNSDVDEWVRFARGLDPEIYFPVFVRDTSVALGGVPKSLAGVEIFEEGPWNLEIRMALYQQSYLNLFVGNGPGMLCILNRQNRVLMFPRPESGTMKAKDQFKAAGAEEGEYFPNLPPYQKFVDAQTDKAEVIREKFNALCQVIETSETARSAS